MREIFGKRLSFLNNSQKVELLFLTFKEQKSPEYYFIMPSVIKV